MKLRNKLFIGFSSVMTIVITMLFILFIDVKSISTTSKHMDAVDSSVISALIAQGRALRMNLYKDTSYSIQAEEELVKSLSFLEEAKKVTQNTTIIAELDAQAQELQRLQAIVKGMANDYELLRSIDAKMMPLTQQITSNLTTLKNRAKGYLLVNNTAHYLDIYDLISSSLDSFKDIRLSARIYAADPTPENQKATLESLEHAFLFFDRLASITGQEENSQLVQDIQSMTEDYHTEFTQMVAVRSNLALSLSAMRQSFTVLVKRSLQLSSNATDALMTTSESSNHTMLIGALIVLLASVGIAITLTRNVLVQLGKDPGELVVIAERVTQGDYDIDDGTTHQGVHGRFVQMVNALKQHIENAQQESQRAQSASEKAQLAMTEAEQASQEAQDKTHVMQSAAHKLDDVIAIVSSASTQLSAQIEQAERGASEQAARISETATAVEEMNSTVLEVAKNAGTAAELSTNTQEKALEGSQMVYACITSIDNVQKDALTLKKDMEALSEHTKNITQIMSVISDIADQTNLLALNAAIEAARAGDAGRGFAVVADEVRKLAEKTMSSTSDVANAIRAIQESSTASTKQVEVTVKNVDQATELAGRCGAVLKDILDMAELSADQVRAIATASEQQSASSEEIAQSIGQVNTIAEETSQAMLESSRAITDLSQQTQTLSNLIVSMKNV